MRVIVSKILQRLTLLSLVAVLAACGGGVKDASVRPVNVPSSFDVTLIAEKDDQFDFQEVPLTGQELRSALNYRKEQSLPMSTVLLKRGEKQRVKDSHLVTLARIAVALGFTAYVEEKGEINEIRTTTTTTE